MRALGICLVMIALVACGPADSAPSGASDDVSKAVDEAVGQAMKGDYQPVAVSEERCALLENGVVTDMFDVRAELLSYRRSIPSKLAGHVVCSANWDNPDKAALESAYMEKMQAWGRGRASGNKEPMPKAPRLQNSVAITLVATQFDTADAAVASLEDSVASLKQGINFKVAGKDHVTQVDFGNWIDGVGDKAIFTDKDELLVADKGKRFSVVVEVADDAQVNREYAIVLAGKVMESL